MKLLLAPKAPRHRLLEVLLLEVVSGMLHLDMTTHESGIAGTKHRKLKGLVNSHQDLVLAGLRHHGQIVEEIQSKRHQHLPHRSVAAVGMKHQLIPVLHRPVE
jgi:hypothetical protein